jgi:hypothetical protein
MNLRRCERKGSLLEVLSRYSIAGTQEGHEIPVSISRVAVAIRAVRHLDTSVVTSLLSVRQ